MRDGGKDAMTRSNSCSSLTPVMAATHLLDINLQAHLFLDISMAGHYNTSVDFPNLTAHFSSEKVLKLLRVSVRRDTQLPISSLVLGSNLLSNCWKHISVRSLL